MDDFHRLSSVFGKPDIDLFASRLNKQVEHDASWLSDPGSCIIDAMPVSWHKQYVYIFPPFSMIWPALKKVQREFQKALIIVPKWTIQSWFPVLLQLAVAQPTEQHTINTSGNEEDPPPQPQVKASSGSMLQRHHRAREFSEQATNILSAAWRKNTKSKDEGAIKSYASFCHEREADPYNSNDTRVIEFLTQEFERVMSSSAINGMITVIKKIKNS